ncbi:hypothetical protein EJD97_003738 [Solanum chilense]|uniref:Uncharacterized protein n=1 Tax=Solanum chilense TaxID=4083 RepID=A0A6N2CBA0_SOLCI|nr:hypothetical protein EJD97_003738 [Solanum chilense]
MDVQSTSKRFTLGISLHVENNVEHPSFSLGLTQDFREISRSISKSNTMQDIISKLRNDPTRFVDGGLKDHANVVAGSSKKGKIKLTFYTIHNDKNEIVGSGSFRHQKVSV